MAQERVDLMAECNPGSEHPAQQFEAVVCRQCANARCRRSSYADTATQKKIERHGALMGLDPATTPPSPLSGQGEDPWAVTPRGSASPMDLYREYSDPKQDPWSAEYEGTINRTVKPGSTVRMPGKR